MPAIIRRAASRRSCTCGSSLRRARGISSFPGTAAWWLEHYRELATCSTPPTSSSWPKGVCVIYELRESAAFDAFAAMDLGGAPTMAVMTRPAPDAAADAGASGAAAITARADDTRAVRIRTVSGRRRRNRGACSRGRCLTVERRSIVVDNALPRDVVERAPRRVGADRRRQQRAGVLGVRSRDRVRRVRTSGRTTSCIRHERLQHALRGLSRAVRAVAAGRGAGRPACIGHIDCYNEPIDVGTYRSQHWIRSCFFFLPPAEAPGARELRVGRRRPRTSSAAIRTHPSARDAPLDQRYREYITSG